MENTGSHASDSVAAKRGRRRPRARPSPPDPMPANPFRVGAVFGRLTVLAFVGYSRACKSEVCRCRCACGREVTVHHKNLISGNTKACGCLHRKHGRADTPEHRTWRKIRQRCCNPKTVQFANYGGRGIRVCERWAEFGNFLADMGERPSPKHSIERIDVNGHYAPENCRWATNAEQQQNRRDTVRLTYCGETHSLSEWARRRGLDVGTLWGRLRRGWPLEAMLGTPASIGSRFRLPRHERLPQDPGHVAQRQARGAVNYALRTGRLVRPACCQHPGCGEAKTTAYHHHGYESRLDVIWLCRTHRRLAGSPTCL
jgi:hypothetical protein